MAMYNPFWEQQQKFFKSWSENSGIKVPGMDALEKMYDNMMPGVEDFYKKWTGSIPGMDDYAKFWGAKIPGMEVYGKVFDFWKGMSDPAEFMKTCQEKYTDLMQDYCRSVLPENVMSSFTKPQELLDTCVEFYKNVMSPWLQIDPSILERIASGDKQAYVDFFKEVNGKFEESFGKVFNMMGFGINRESYGEQMQALSCYYKLLFSAGELMALVLNTSTDTMKEIVSRYQQGLKDGQEITDFRDFYKLWYKVNEDALIALFNTEDFSKAFCDYSDKYSKYIIAMNAVYERALDSVPVPTKKDMDSLYSTVYNLRKEVRDLRRDVDALKSEISGK